MRFLLLGFVLCFSGLMQAQDGRIEQLDVLVFNVKLKHIKQALFDIRSHDDYLKAHIHNAKHLSWPGKDAETILQSIKKNEPVYLYGNSSEDALRLAKHLTEKGFSSVVFLAGGFDAWQRAGYQID